MSTQLSIETFEEIYNLTYNKVLKYTICNCSNLDEVNDTIQDIYTELYKSIIKKRQIVIENVESYIIGIAKNKIKRKYNNKVKQLLKEVDSEGIEQISDLSIDIENDLITKDNALEIWNYLKTKRKITAKVFYLYYILDLPIKTIAKDLEISESNVKNNLYRTKKELKNNFQKGEDCNGKR